jgi:hypothetical protein
MQQQEMWREEITNQFKVPRAMMCMSFFISDQHLFISGYLNYSVKVVNSSLMADAPSPILSASALFMQIVLLHRSQ